MVGISSGQDEGLEGRGGRAAVVSLAFQFQEPVVDVLPDLTQSVEVGQELADPEVVGVVDGGLGAEGAVALPILLNSGAEVLDVDGGVDIGAEDAGPEGVLALVLGKALVEEQLHPLGTAEVELVADDLLEELAAMEGPVEDLGAAHLKLQDGELVDIALVPVG